MAQTHYVQVKNKTFYTIVRTRFRTELKVPRPSHTKKSWGNSGFQATCQVHLQQAISADNLRPIGVISQDESRFGLLTVRRRRLTAHGVPPLGSVQHVFEWFYVYGAMEPTTGPRFYLELPYLNAESFQLFVDAFAEAFPDSLNLLLLDDSGPPTAQQLTLPEPVRLVFLPPYGPELTLIERVWRDPKNALAWLQFPTLEVQQDYLATLLQRV